MSARKLLDDLVQRGISVTLDGGRLRIVAPKGKITAETRDTVAANKPELVEILRSPALKGSAVRYKSDLFEEDIWIVADEEDARLLGKHRGRIYTVEEARLVRLLRSDAQVQEVHFWKLQFDAVLKSVEPFDREVA